MKYLYHYLFSLSLIPLISASAFGQNPDSVKAYMMEFIEPEVNFSMTYGTGSLSLKYVEQAPLSPATEEFIEEKKAEYEKTNDPMLLCTIGQTYSRMNRHRESQEWTERALQEVEFLMEKYPDSIELVETAFLIYIDTGNSDLATIASKMIADHYQNSVSLFSEALAYSLTGQHDKGIVVCNKGLLLYPGESKWYLARIIHDFTEKIQRFGFGTPEFSAEENRIDRSFLDEGFKNYPDSLEVELVSVLGNFFLFAYEDVMPKFYEELSSTSGDFNLEGFEFDIGPELEKKLDVYFKQVTKLSKRKAFKNWHAIDYTLGVIHMFRSEMEKAAEYFENGIRLMEPKYRQGQDNVYHYYDNLIACYRILGDMDSAEKSVVARATEEINIAPVPNYHIEMALYRVMDKDFQTAIDILDKTIAMDSLAIDAYSHKAMVLMLLDETDEAAEYLSAASSINSNDLITFKAIILFNLLAKSSTAVDQINQLEAYDPTDEFITEARHLLSTE